MQKQKTGPTLASLKEADFSRIVQNAYSLGFNLRDMGSGYALTKVGTEKRVGFLSLNTPIAEVYKTIEWFDLTSQ